MLQEKPSALKREHPALQNMKILYFFSIIVGHFCPTGSGSGSAILMRIRIRIQQPKLMRIHADPDPDPKPCIIYYAISVFCKKNRRTGVGLSLAPVRYRELKYVQL